MGIALAAITHKIFHGTFLDLGVFWLVSLLWAILLVYIRSIYRKVLEFNYSWHEGHYLAATTILMIGYPYRKAKRSAALN